MGPEVCETNLTSKMDSIFVNLSMNKIGERFELRSNTRGDKTFWLHSIFDNRYKLLGLYCRCSRIIDNKRSKGTLF